MSDIRRSFVFGFVLLGLCASAAHAQELMPMPPAGAPMAPAAEMPPGALPSQNAPSYTQEQLDQLLAPVALYPDQLLGQVLIASTYPLEVVEANRWLQNQQNAALNGDQLAAAMQQQPWDPSVKSLVAFPQTLSMMDQNLQWTEQLGDAFLAQQPAVMDTVQHLRQMAQSSNHLSSTAQETVSSQDGDIIIAPPTPQTVYIPYYDPSVVYGTWPYPDYPPYYFPAPPGYVYYNDGFIGFGVGLVVADALWGWDRWDWHDHHIDIDQHRWENLGGHAPGNGGVWQHDPSHRHGVPYHSAAVRAQFGAAQAQARTNFRGYSAPAENRNAGVTRAQYQNNNYQSHATPQIQTHASVQSRATAQFHQAAPQQHAAPAFESFSRGAEVHTQAARGAASFASMHAAAPQGGGNHGGGQDRR